MQSGIVCKLHGGSTPKFKAEQVELAMVISDTDYKKAENKREGHDADDADDFTHGPWLSDIALISVKNARQLISDQTYRSSSMLMCLLSQHNHKSNNKANKAHKANKQSDEPDNVTGSESIGSKCAHRPTTPTTVSPIFTSPHRTHLLFDQPVNLSKCVANFVSPERDSVYSALHAQHRKSDI